jgi:hypothetical protein
VFVDKRLKVSTECLQIQPEAREFLPNRYRVAPEMMVFVDERLKILVAGLEIRPAASVFYRTGTVSRWK